MVCFGLLVSLVWASEVPVGETGDVWVYAPTPVAKTELQGLGLGWSEGSEDGWWRMRAGPEQMERLRRSGLTWRPHVAATTAVEAYLQPEEMISALETLAGDHPDRVSLFDAGWSEEGRPIVGVRITDSLSPTGHWRILGAHHGDETSSAELALYTAEQLATTEDPALLGMLDQEAVWVIPHVNPDGVARLQRYNSNWVDLNRNYGYEWRATEMGSGEHPFSESETRNIRSLAAYVQFGAGLSMHSGATNIGWVWNYTTTPTGEVDLLTGLSNAYGESCGQEGFYETNGAEWYITHGDTTDWAYGAHGTLDFTLEVTNRKNPAEDNMVAALDNHWPAVQSFLSWPWRVSGVVFDAETDRPIPATVALLDHDIKLPTGLDGRFSRPTESDLVDVAVSAPGYETELMALDPSSGETLEVRLQPLTLGTALPVPRLLTRTGEGQFLLDIDATDVKLSRPGEEQVEAEQVGETWVVDLDALSPGPWDISIDGTLTPRALFLGEVDDLSRISAVDIDPTNQVLITGEGFGRGTRAWGLWGAERALVELSVVAESPTEIRLDADELPLDDEPVDVIVLTNGHQLSILDVGQDVDFDEDAPTEGSDSHDDTPPDATDSGQPPTTEEQDSGTGDPSDTAAPSTSTPLTGDDESGDSIGKPLGCGGCQTTPSYPFGWALVTLLTLPGLRRRT